MLQEIEQEQLELQEIERKQRELEEIERKQRELEEIQRKQRELEEIQRKQRELEEIEREELELQEIEYEKMKLQELCNLRFKQEQKTINSYLFYLLLLCLFLLCLFLLCLSLLPLFKQKEQEESTEEAPAVNVGLLNVHSIRNMKGKRIEIKNLITEHKLDVFLMTETWLNETADESPDVALNESSPPNFKFHYKCRTEKRGGGVAILYSEVFQELSSRIYLNSITIFEYVAANLSHKKWNEDVVFITVYNPPKTLFEDFLKEFILLLNEAPKHSPVIVAGDFNFNVTNNNKTKPPSKDQIKKFKDAYKTHGFKQHVDEPTRKRSTLDLVFSRNVEVSDEIKINRDKYKDSDRYISDHSTVYFSIRPKSKGAKTKAIPFKKEE